MSTLSYENPLQFVSITLNVIFPRSECRENTRNEFNRTIERLRSAFFLSSKTIQKHFRTRIRFTGTIFLQLFWIWVDFRWVSRSLALSLWHLKTAHSITRYKLNSPILTHRAIEINNILGMRSVQLKIHWIYGAIKFLLRLIHHSIINLWNVQGAKKERTLFSRTPTNCTSSFYMRIIKLTYISRILCPKSCLRHHQKNGKLNLNMNWVWPFYQLGNERF